MKSFIIFFIAWQILFNYISAQVLPGLDVFFLEHHDKMLKGKKIGLITNHTALDSHSQNSAQLFISHAKNYKIVAFFSPEHGIDGAALAGEKVQHSALENIPVFSLHGKTKRPTKAMLKNIDVLIYDIQEIGSRSYTYTTTLFYCMEEAKKNHISMIILDRPNPLTGTIVDGPMLDEKWRSFIGYINIPYCHGMTIGELAQFFNEEYHINCNLTVIRMKGWKRTMSFSQTGLTWIPSSPHIPEADTPFYYSSTGILGELNIVNIGIGYTLPFKLVGAPWINAKKFADELNKQQLPGVRFIPFHFVPFYGMYKNKMCHGVYISITDHKMYKPLSVQFLLMGILKSLYPNEFTSRLTASSTLAKKLFCQVIGTDKIYQLLLKEKYPAWKLIEYDRDKRNQFMQKRKKYLFAEYAEN